MTTLCLVRHGETAWNAEGRLQGRNDIELNDAGINQAVSCAKFLHKYSWDIVVSSPLTRSVQTAEIISKSVDVKNICLSEEFVERDFGSATGLLASEVKEKYPNRMISDEEQIDLFNTRVMKGTELLLQEYKDKNIILVTHAGVIKCIVTNLVDKLQNVNVKLGNACITIIKNTTKKWDVELFNYSIE